VPSGDDIHAYAYIPGIHISSIFPPCDAAVQLGYVIHVSPHD
jgi:hypothetical protein